MQCILLFKKEVLSMKKYSIRIIIICIFFGIISFSFYLQWGQEMEICNTTSETANNYYSLDITIIAHRLYIRDKEKFAESAIQKCVENSWKDIRFSYDLSGYPNELNIDVYMSNCAYHSHKMAFTIVYSQDNNFEYNIKDNPDKFTIKLIE